MTQMNLCTKQKQTHRHGEQVCGGQEKGAVGRMDGEFGISRCKPLYIEWIERQGPAV